MTLAALSEQTYAPAPAEAPGQLRRFLRPQEIHKSTGIPAGVIYDALACGELPALDISRPPLPGRKKKPVYLIDPEDFAAWCERRKTRAGGK